MQVIQIEGQELKEEFLYCILFFFAFVFLGEYDLSALLYVYFIGLAYLTSVEYYKYNQNSTHFSHATCESTRSVIIGWTRFCGLLLFDNILNYARFVIFRLLIIALRIVMYMSFTCSFVNFLKEQKVQLSTAHELMRANAPNVFKINKSIEINNVFDHLFVNLVIINNRLLHYMCIELVIKLLERVTKQSDILLESMIVIFNNIREQGFVNYIYNLKYKEIIHKKYEHVIGLIIVISNPIIEQYFANYISKLNYDIAHKIGNKFIEIKEKFYMLIHRNRK